MNTLRLTREDGTIDEYKCRIGDDMGDDGALVVDDDGRSHVIDACDPDRSWASFLADMDTMLGAFVAAEIVAGPEYRTCVGCGGLTLGSRSASGLHLQNVCQSCKQQADNEAEARAAAFNNAFGHIFGRHDASR